MKKIITFLFVFAMSSAAYAVSTCETRVDSHPKATTRQRVVYCLTEEPVVTSTVAGPELVYSGTYSRTPEEEETPKSTVKDGYFKEEKLSVERQYVGSGSFPAFVNDTLSEQERAALEEVYLRELEKQQQALDPSFAAKKATTERAPARLNEPVAETATTTATAATTSLTSAQVAKGLLARQQKPVRVMKMAGEPVPEVVVQPQGLVSQMEQQAVTTTDPLLDRAYNEDELLNDGLGLADTPAAAPIPAPANQQ